MGTTAGRRLGRKLLYLCALAVLFLVAFAGFVWLFIEVMFLSSG